MSSVAPPASPHIPVLLRESIDGLSPRAGGVYIDGTFGGGGHTAAILAASAPSGLVLALDLDDRAVDRANGLASDPRYVGRLIAEHSSFVDMRSVAEKHGLLAVDGILLDLGMSSFQLDAPERGFAFSQDGRLDMRFDTSRGASAAELVNTLGERELADIIWRFGEDQKSRRIARVIVGSRSRVPIETTTQLAEIVETAVGGRRGAAAHPATRTFQALRIAVNEELATLSSALPEAVRTLTPGGRLAVIAFHSLEDRIVKQFFKRESSRCICPPEQPVCTCGHMPSLKTMGKAIMPSADEIARNPRSRSAVLRVAERIQPDGPVGR